MDGGEVPKNDSSPDDDDGYQLPQDWKYTRWGSGIYCSWMSPNQLCSIIFA
jgi:hypothetical protein